MRLKNLLDKNLAELLVILVGSLIGFILMFGTFYEKNNTIFIAAKAWSDFASHIPLIRSFSLGINFPPQYPLFPGEPIKYHFLFYYFVGILEKIGLNIGLALNIPSSVKKRVASLASYSNLAPCLRGIITSSIRDGVVSFQELTERVRVTVG